MKTYTIGNEQPRSRRWPYVLAVVFFLAGYLYLALGRPASALQPKANSIQARVPGGGLSWPAQGQSAVGIVGSPILETHGNQRPVPTASTAKLITALTVLAAKPLKPGQQGPTITLSPSDVALYNNYMAQDGSLVKVQAGERISEYQMLQAVLLPSANNIADSLAIWAFGSLKDYSGAANQYLRDQGLVESHVGSDASGLNPSTTSSPRDLVRIGELVMQDPVLSKIVNQPSASGIPVVSNIKNVNFLLGTSNIIGIKTGNSDQAGGVFVSASRVTINNKPVTIVTALAGSPTLFQAMKDSLALIQSAQKNFEPVTVVEAGSIVGSYKQPWGGSVPAVATKALSIDAWGGSTVAAKVNLRDIPANSKAGQTVGSVDIPQSATSYKISVPVKLKTTPSAPSIGWRLTHPF